MKTSTILFAAGLAIAAAPAFADTINFGQFGSEGTSVADGASGVTTGGVDFTVTGPGNGYTIYDESPAGDWNGQFVSGTPLLFDNSTPGAIDINFATPISSITGIALQDNYFGAYTATLTAYNSSDVELGSVTYSSNNEGVGSGPIPTFDFSSAGISEIVFTSTNDGLGAALGGVGGVPEPATWALMLTGIAGLGAAMRFGRRKAAIA